MENQYAIPIGSDTFPLSIVRSRAAKRAPSARIPLPSHPGGGIPQPAHPLARSKWSASDAFFFLETLDASDEAFVSKW
ncbi:LmbE-like protein [Anopheles sinensis]|uniref:LmbE-like protein n=1 Tax=Anopheles sinensis TaxID=74873 RepID=A0A084VHD9_ANOSI|nr:LmbE-like protein [Anopheles sinensis]